MNKDTLIAHIRRKEDRSGAPSQPLIDHFKGSARLASEFAEIFTLQNPTPQAIPQKYRDNLQTARPVVPPWKFDNRGLDMSLWIRMLFSYAVEIHFLGMDKVIPEKGGY